MKCRGLIFGPSLKFFGHGRGPGALFVSPPLGRGIENLSFDGVGWKGRESSIGVFEDVCLAFLV